MYFRFQRRHNLLQLSDTFARLVSVHENGDLEFEFTYDVSQREVVKREAMTVQVTVTSRNIKRKRLVDESVINGVNVKSLVNNVLTQMPDAKSSIKQQEGYTVASRKSDISSKVNNEILPQLRSGVPKSQIIQLKKPRLKLVSTSDVKESNETKPILHFTAHPDVSDAYTLLSSSVSIDVKAAAHNMIVKQGKDPSQVVEMTHRSVTSYDSKGGLLRRSRREETSFSSTTQLMNHHLFPPNAVLGQLTTSALPDSTRVHVLVEESTEDIQVPVTVVLPRSLRNVDGAESSHLLVKMELIDGRSGLAIDSVVRPLDVSRHVQLYFTPRHPPIVRVAKSEVSSRANIEIKQVDHAATSVQVFKKVLSIAVTDVEDYALVGSYELKHSDQSLLVPVEVPRSSTVIYRVVPVGPQGAIGFEYTNVVVTPKRYQPVKAIALTARPIDGGVQVEARKIPPNVVAIEFQVVNKTTFEKQHRNVSGDVAFIDDASKVADHVVVIDRNVSPGHVYEYTAKLIYRDGRVERSGNATIEFITPAPGKVDTRITSVGVTYTPTPNVTFSITTDVIDTTQDVIKTLLQRQDIFEQFQGDVLREREFLKNLIAHNVQRVDLSTGEREDFGVVTALSFDDEALRKNLSISPLKLGHKYRYEVTALLRSPETMFETLQKENIDQVTKKPYRFNPAKFLHPVALSRGTLVTSQGLKTRFSKDAMSHGAIGSVVASEVSFDDEQARVVDGAAAAFDRSLNLVTWKLRGSIDQVDHFLVMKEVNGVRTIIGKTHSEFQYGNCQFLHTVTKRDSGALAYVIVPVFNDYKTGTAAYTNTVLVD